MGFSSYEGIPDDVLDRQHTTSTGETYTLRHDENLKVEMQYLGKGNSGANAQGWERNSGKYFDTLYQNHPEMFSKKNIARIQDKKAPIVDQKMISCHPEWAQYRNQSLVHHHIGGDGEAVALPKNAHKGQGEIHNVEKAAGITEHCRSFSNDCGKQADSVGKTSSQLHSQLSAKGNDPGNGQNKGADAKTASRASAPQTQTAAETKAANGANTRSDAVKTAASQGSSSASGRSDAVKNTASSASKSTSDRSDAVRSVSAGNTSGGQSHSSGGQSHSSGSSSGSGSGHSSSAGSGSSSGSGSGHGSSSGGSSQSR